MNWQLHPRSLELQHELSSSLNISPITACVLINRGIRTVEEATRFLYPTLQQLHDPFLMADMEKAVKRVMFAIKNKEHITVYGDYDTDGATSTALILKFFKMIGVEADYYIPSRVGDGYGLNKRSIDTLKERGTNLIITVDNGINAAGPIDHAKGLGMDVVVTDHHVPGDTLPRASAVVNPKRPDCKFPFKGLAGVGVAFNLIVALRQRLREAGFFNDREEPRLKELLDIVAVGTVADAVPLVDENRILVKFGLEELKKTSSTLGLNALKIISGLEPHQINTTMIAFRIAPRINAAGRIDDQNLGTILLTTDDAVIATEIAQRLNTINSRRQSMEETVLKKAHSIVTEDERFKDWSGLTIHCEGWHPGIVGLIATRISDAYKKPTVAVGFNDGIGRGSARSVGNYNIIEALSKCKDMLIAFGGHTHAAGVTIAPDKIERFMERFNEVVSETFKEGDSEENVMMDAELEAADISEKLVEEMEFLSPFGEGNLEPMFCMRELKVSGAKIVAEKHLKLKFAGDMVLFDTIGFGMGHHDIAKDDILDVAFVPQMDTWRGMNKVQLKLRDLKPVD